jgi:hypothetical protein
LVKLHARSVHELAKLAVGGALGGAFSGLVGVSEEQAAIITLLVTANATRLRYRRFDI